MRIRRDLSAFNGPALVKSCTETLSTTLSKLCQQGLVANSCCPGCRAISKLTATRLRLTTSLATPRRLLRGKAPFTRRTICLREGRLHRRWDKRSLSDNESVGVVVVGAARTFWRNGNARNVAALNLNGRIFRRALRHLAKRVGAMLDASPVRSAFTESPLSADEGDRYVAGPAGNFATRGCSRGEAQRARTRRRDQLIPLRRAAK